MKKLIILLILTFFFSGLQAQTFNELFRQKKTQKKYLIKQIALLKIYLKAVKKGYSIAKEGLTTIGDIKDGDLNLHTEYFNSLKNVNPDIAGHAKVADIISMQTEVLKTYRHFYPQIEESGAFNSDEVEYVYRVYRRLLEDCGNTIEELITITTSGKFEMKDNERLERIDALYLDIQDKRTFAQNFGNGTLIIAASRIQEKNSIETSLLFNGIIND
jgi:hypothetical protein